MIFIVSSFLREAMKPNFKKTVPPTLMSLGISAMPSCTADPDYALSQPVNFIGGGRINPPAMPVDPTRPRRSISLTDTVFTGAPMPVPAEFNTASPIILEGGRVSSTPTGSGFTIASAPSALTQNSATVPFSLDTQRPIVSMRPKNLHRSKAYPFLRGKTAIAPAGVPAIVRAAFSYGNDMQDKHYRLGGGHANLNNDTAYDCSGTTSYVLRNCNLMTGTRNSTGFMSYGRPGVGKFITIWAKPGHVFMEICGLRLDTGGSTTRTGPRWKTQKRSYKGFVPRHPMGL